MTLGVVLIKRSANLIFGDDHRYSLVLNFGPSFLPKIEDAESVVFRFDRKKKEGESVGSFVTRCLFEAKHTVNEYCDYVKNALLKAIFNENNKNIVKEYGEINF